nr:MAG TPA: hypothetical protein [Caudoviricetes sp.]
MHLLAHLFFTPPPSPLSFLLPFHPYYTLIKCNFVTTKGKKDIKDIILIS